MIEEFKNKYEKCSNIQNEISKLTKELNETEANKVISIKAKTTPLLLLPLLSYIFLIFFLNPTGGNTLLEILIPSKDVHDSVYLGVSKIIYINLFIYFIAATLEPLISNKIISKNVKSDFNSLGIVEIGRFFILLFIILISFALKNDGMRNEVLIVMLFIYIVSFCMEVLVLKFYLKENKNKKIETCDKKELIEKFNLIEELKKEFEKEKILKDNLKNEILKNPLLMKEVINSIYIDELNYGVKNYKSYLVKELKSRSAKKGDIKTEMEKINSAYKNIYNKDIENNFEIENS